MITLTRLSGSRFVLNSDLIERVDATPDTVITLTHGTKYVVRESLEEVVEAALTFRSQIVAVSGQIAPLSTHRAAVGTHLASVSTLDAPGAAPDRQQDGQQDGEGL